MLKIKEVRESKHLTQTEVAERMGIKQSTYAEIESGNPTMESLAKIAEVLEVSPAELIADTRPKQEARSLDGIVKHMKIIESLMEDRPNILSAYIGMYGDSYINLYGGLSETAKEYEREVRTEDRSADGGKWLIHSITLDGIKVVRHEAEKGKKDEAV
jgi:transcriptional regulator with XRE-family HTH domain